MLKNLKTEDLKIGMYVIIQAKWHEHPFLKNQFSLTSEWQITKLRESGIGEVTIDTERSGLPDEDSASHNSEEKHEEQGTTITIPEEFFEAVHDKKMAPEKKAEVVYQYSMTMMSSLLDSPTAKNIRTAKTAIADIVDLILSDDATSHHLLSITSHDFYTYTHSVNVGILSIAIVKSVFKGSDAHDMHELGAGFFLHDLGKVGIDNNIINKPGKLTDEEMKEMRRHPALGFNLLKETRRLTTECKIIVLQHHERDDGTGYPQKLRGNEIHIYGRICSLADIYDALTSERPYKNRLTPFDGLKVMKETMLNHFQKELFEHFVLLFTR